MSFTIVEQATPRLNRSELAVPGSRPALFAKAAASKADVVFLDCEDAVAPDEKEKAREHIVQGLNEVDFGDKTVSVRINGLDTHWMYRDVIEVIERGGERLDLMMIPKVGTAELIIETALGMANVEAIAAASRRNESLHFGVADYAASTKARTTGIGGPNREYGVLTDPLEDGRRDYHWGDMWHYAIARLVVAARACGLRPVDGPFGDFSDPDGFTAQGRRAAVLGCEGKWAIHPAQIALANEIFSPSAEEVAKAERILEAMAQAQKEGQGAVSLDGRLIDIASIKQAENLVKKAEQIAAVA
jgi:malyl-CoA/(S)-citramalyl-CoA lyase